MAGLPASVFANLPDSAAATLREALSRRSALNDVDDSPISTDNADDGPSEEDGDRVTLRGSSAQASANVQAGLDAAGLYTLMETLNPVVQNPAGNEVGVSSVRAMFGQATALIAKTGFSQMLDKLDKQLVDMSEGDPEQVGRLKILIAALAKLNPDGAESMLRQISSAMKNVLDIWRNQSMAPPPAPNASPATTTTTTEMVHFELDFQMEFSGEAEFVLAELRDQGIEVQAARVEFSQSISIHIEFTGIRQETQKSDPLILDLNGDGVALTGVEDGADFDIDGDGSIDRSAFVQGDDAFLALDRNGNGHIDGGQELFGDQHGALNGFEELAKFDDNRDGAIDRADAIFDSLRLMHDKNSDGQVGRSEFSTLAEQNIQSLDLGYLAGREDDLNGNTLAEHASFRRSDGTNGNMVDAWLRYRG